MSLIEGPPVLFGTSDELGDSVAHMARASHRVQQYKLRKLFAILPAALAVQS